MLTIKLLFAANRYHVPRRYRYGNDDSIDWPPSPWHILRGLAVTWKRLLSDLPPHQVVPILETLAAGNPSYYLPQTSLGHYQQFTNGVTKRTAPEAEPYVVLQPGQAVFVVWPETELSSRQYMILNTILRNMPCLGHAESWVEAELTSDCPIAINSFALESGSIPPGNWEIVRVLVPRPQIKLEELLMEPAALQGNSCPDPEGAVWWLYVRERDCFTKFRTEHVESPQNSWGTSVVRFALAGPALPMAGDTLQWGDMARKSMMAQYGRRNEGKSSPILSGKDEMGKPLHGHPHAFYLPMDEDGDGRLDHLTIWTSHGLNEREFQAAISVRTLNLGNGGGKVQLVYQAHGKAEDFAEVSPQLFGCSKSWRSLTPYVLTRHIKFRGPRDENGQKRMVDGPEEQIRREVRQRWPEGQQLVRAERASDRNRRISPVHEGKSEGLYPTDFFRYRRGGSNGGGAYNFELEFEKPVSGPVALGFACHYGLGLFIPKQL